MPNFCILRFFLEFNCCPRRIRTTTDRTKNCSATITPWDNQYKLFPVSFAKVMDFSSTTKFLSVYFTVIK